MACYYDIVTTKFEVQTTRTIGCQQTVHVLCHYCAQSCDYYSQDEVTNKVNVHKLTITNDSR